ncbi:hypothetical protein IWX65_002870 [Arthrobacter sp. CAN_A214]|uniref:hypothetical protein n=1 Tax=Arthrobacter sp. CAN_A214 TaxID=2787720 RepID=UPI0018CAE246
MAVKKGLKGLLNQGSQEMLAAMQRDPEPETSDPGSGGGAAATLPISAPTGPASPVNSAPTAVSPDGKLTLATLEAAQEPQKEAAPVPMASPARPGPSHIRAAPIAPQDTPAAEPDPLPSKKPSWEEMDRKEVRVYSDQVLALTTLRLKINKGKKGSERITDNTLIRTAIDLLLERQEDIGGVTENEIRASCGLDPRY